MSTEPETEYLPPVKAHGVRLGLLEMTEELSTTIIIPQVTENQRQKRLGRIFSKGPDAKYVEEGDTILFQIPKSVSMSSTYRLALNEKSFLFVHYEDALAKITGGSKVALENFTIIGRWLLLELVTNVPIGILLPDNTPVSLEDVRFKVVQIGNGVENPPYEVGDEICVERTRANPIILDGKEYAFLDKTNVYGVVQKPKKRELVFADKEKAPA